MQLGKFFPGDTAVEAIFELDYIVICRAREVPHDTAAHSVQLQLMTANGVRIYGTLIVANLRYFHFNTKPGVFRLELREGRGREIFELESVGTEGWASPTVKEAEAEINVTSFEGLALYLRRRRLPETDQVDVVKVKPIRKEMFQDLSSNVMSMLKSPKKEPSTDIIPVKPQADINIFSVA